MAYKEYVLLYHILIVQLVFGQNITEYIDAFNNELKTLFCDGLSVGGDKCDNDNYGIQDFVDSLSDHFETDDIEITSITQEMIKNLDSKLNLRVSFLTNMSSYIQQSCIQYGYSDYSDIEAITDFDELAFAGNTERDANLPSDMEYNSVYNMEVSLSQSTYKLPNGINYTDENIQKDAQVNSSGFFFTTVEMCGTTNQTSSQLSISHTKLAYLDISHYIFIKQISNQIIDLNAARRYNGRFTR